MYVRFKVPKKKKIFYIKIKKKNTICTSNVHVCNVHDIH